MCGTLLLCFNKIRHPSCLFDFCLLRMLSCCCRFFKPLWMGACGCLHASQLTKVRSHAAAALAAMVQHLRTPLRRSGKNMKASVESGPNGFEGTPIQQLHCASCMAPLLTQAWKALTAAAAETSGLTSSLNSGEKPQTKILLLRARLNWVLFVFLFNLPLLEYLAECPL